MSQSTISILDLRVFQPSLTISRIVIKTIDKDSGVLLETQLQNPGIQQSG